MQRPPHDKDYVQQCIKQLHKFLLGLGFPGTVTVKDIQSTLEDFEKVTESIHAFVELSFQIPTNEFDEETLKMLKDLGYSFTERAGISEEKDKAFFKHLVTVMSLAKWLQKKLEISCSSEAHKAAPEKETAGRSEEQELGEVENIRLILERQKLIASNERYNRKNDEMEQKILKIEADIERSKREKDELRQTIQREKQSTEVMKQKKLKADIERGDRVKDELLQTHQRLKQRIKEMEQKARNEKVTVSKTQEKNIKTMSE